VIAELVRRSLVTSASKVAALLAGLVSVAITSRVLGPEGRGSVVVVTTIVGLGATFGSLSLGQVTLRRAATERSSAWLPSAVGVLGTAVAVVSVLFALGLAVGITSGALPALTRVSAMHLALGAAALPVTLWTGYAGYVLLALDRVGASNRAQVAGTVTSLVAIAALVLWQRLGVAGALIAALVGQIAAAVVGFGVIRRALGAPVRLERAAATAYVRDGSKLHLTAIGAYLFSSLDILMVSRYHGPAAAGVFQLAFQLYAPLLLVPQAVTEVLSGKLAALGPDGLWPMQRRLLALTALAMVAGAVVLGLLAPVLVRTIGGPQFAESATVFRIYLLSVLAATLNGIMGVQWIGRGLLWQSSVLTLGAGVLNFGANLMLIPRYGAAGAATATVIGGYAIPFTANVILAWRCERTWRRGPARAVATVAVA
jgi:O-antigen/teichoic acid export membrane protein